MEVAAGQPSKEKAIGAADASHARPPASTGMSAASGTTWAWPSATETSPTTPTITSGATLIAANAF